MQKNHRAAIFDLDGVIVNTGPYHMEAWKMVLEDAAIPFDESKFRHMFGMRDTEVIPRLIGLMDDAKIAELVQKKDAAYDKLIAHYAEPMDGLREFIDVLVQRDVQRAVASSASKHDIMAILKMTGLAEKLPIVITGEQPMRGKPAPDIFLMAMYRLDIPAEQTVIFEDAVSGVEAARQAGATTVALTTSFSAGELSHADLVIENFRDPRLLELF